MPVSAFMQNGKTYIDKAAQYLDARRLTVQDVGVVPYLYKNHGLVTEEGEPYILEGWGYRLRGPDGGPQDDAFLLRVCNYPEDGTKLYHRQGKELKEWTARPKFLQTFKGEYLHYGCPEIEVVNSHTVMLHEKISSCELSQKYLGIPSLAISGCAGWSNSGDLWPNLKRVITNLERECRLVVCFDGDIIENPNIMQAAAQLKGWVSNLRPDVTVVFPMVPENGHGVGWDDWAVEQGDQLAGNWAMILESEGVDVTDILPIVYMVKNYGVSVKTTKDKVTIEHTIDNYERLMRFPQWANYVQDIDGQIYDRTNIAKGGLDPSAFEIMVTKWLERSVFRGDGAAVRSSSVSNAVRGFLETRQVSIPIELISQQPTVTEEEARAAALKLITDGIRVIGPMSEEQTIETLLRMCRDMVALWTNDLTVDVQWACALVGPSGCGKSNFPHSFLRCFERWGWHPHVAKLPKEGPKATLDELYRTCRDNLVGVFDEYNPEESLARAVERNIFTLSSTRVTRQRQMYGETSANCVRHASLFLTTVDTNKSYIRSSKDAGERRFITFEVVGVKPWYGRMGSDREVITDCAATLLVYGYQLYCQGDTRSATEYSEASTAGYISEANILQKTSSLWAKADLGAVLTKFGQSQYRKTTEDWRFTFPQIVETLLPQERISRGDRADLREVLVLLGMEKVGQARVNTVGGEKMKDEVWRVADWDTFSDALQARL